MQAKMDSEIPLVIMNYGICYGTGCIMKQRDAFLAALALLILWQALAMILELPILPAPVEVLGVFAREFQNGLSKHFLFSLWRVFAGMALSVIVAQSVWCLDLAIRSLSGRPWLGATEHLFDPDVALGLKLGALFHVAVPPLVLWGLWRIGYDRRGWLLQTGIAWVVLPASHFAVPQGNLNFVRGPFDSPQTLLPPLVYLLVLMLGYPLVLYLPSHLLLRRLFPGGADARRLTG